MSTTDGDAIRQGEGIEAAAWWSVWEAAPASVRDAVGLSAERDGALAVFRAGGAPIWLFNRVVGLGIDRPAQPEQVDAILEPFRELGVPHGVSLVSIARPAELPRWLEDRGLVRTTTLARMVRGTDDLPAPDPAVEIRRVGRDQAELFGDTTTRGFQMPSFCATWFAQLCGREGWHTYLAFDAGEPAGTGVLYVHDGVGWLGFGSTVGDRRGRGIHRAMMARRMVDAAALGCRSLQTETNLAVGDEPTPSLNNMKRSGFRMAYTRPNYVFTPPQV